MGEARDLLEELSRLHSTCRAPEAGGLSAFFGSSKEASGARARGETEVGDQGVSHRPQEGLWLLSDESASHGEVP